MKTTKFLGTATLASFCLLAVSRVPADPIPIPLTISINDLTEGLTTVTWAPGTGAASLEWLTVPSINEGVEWAALSGVLVAESGHGFDIIGGGMNSEVVYDFTFLESVGGPVSDQLRVTLASTGTEFSDPVYPYGLRSTQVAVKVEFVSDPVLPFWDTSITPDGAFTLVENGTYQPVSALVTEANLDWATIHSPVGALALEVQVASDVPEAGNTVILIALAVLGCGVIQRKMRSMAV